MRKAYVSAIFRLGKTSQFEGMLGDVGKVYIVDLDNRTFITNPTNIDPGSEGDTLHKYQGRSRGVALYQDTICVAGSINKFSCYDRDTLELLHTVDKPETRYLHQIRERGGFLYVVSTGNDKRYKFDGWDVVEEVFLGDYNDILNPYVDAHVDKKWGEDRVHFNSIGWDEDGDEYHVYHSAHMVFNLTKKEIVYQGGFLRSPHDILFHGGDIIVNSTYNCTTVCIDRKTGKAREIFKADFNDDPGNPDNNWNSTRGLIKFGEYIVVGSIPTRLTTLRRLSSGEYKVEDVFDVSTLEYEAIYDIALDKVG